MDILFVKGLEISCLVGIQEWERKQPQPLIFSIELGFDHRRSASLDDIGDAIEPADVVAELQLFANSRDDLLLDALGEACCGFLQQRYAPSHVTLTIEKPLAAEALACQSVGVRMTRHAARR